MALTVYTYEGTDRDGRRVEGELRAPGPGVVRTRLRRQGIDARRVRKKAQRAGRRIGRRVRTADVAQFSRALATMVRAGVPLVRAFDIVASGSRNPRLADAVTSIGRDVAAGASLTAAFARFPALFDDLYCNLVGVGERSGALDTMLERVATHQEQGEAAKRKVGRALTYPAIVVVTAVLVTAVLLVKVVPQFEAVFASAGADLPALTRFVIATSDALRAWWPGLLLAAIAAGGGIALAMRSPAGRVAFDRVALYLPVAGTVLRQAAVARFARTLATSVSAGVPLVDALVSVAGATGNAVFRDAVLGIRGEVEAGQTLAGAMTTSGAFPDLLVQMVAVGEESGSLDDMLARSATHYETEVDAAVDGLATLVEPLLMAVLGVLVGGLIVAMYLPVFKLGSVFGS